MVFVDCPIHGRLIVHGLFGGTAGFTLRNLSTICPVAGCGRTVPIVDGAYDLRDSIIQSFHATSRESLEAFRDIRNAVAHGTISKEQADAQVAGLGRNYSQIWAWANANPALFSMLGLLLTALIAWWTITAADQSSAEQHEDALRLQSATQSVVQAIESETRVSELERDTLRLIYENFLRRPAGDQLRAPRTKPVSLRPPPFPPKTPGPAASGGNRHERRRAACLARRGKG